ncbi:MAG: hypothetical protein M3Y64_07965 [Gemmatimonadota bacterium]|nr:hypothetical protein [Gemmatimonadota bacterium]
MQVDQPPYSLQPLSFPFPALAALAGRLPLGGGREIALASLTAARLAVSMLEPEPLAVADRTTRASAARVWLASLALPTTMRVPFTRCFESTAGAPIGAAGALRSLQTLIHAHLDAPSSLELERLSRRLANAT